MSITAALTMKMARTYPWPVSHGQGLDGFGPLGVSDG